MNIQKIKKIDDARTDGFNMALLAGSVVLNDYFNFEDEEVRDFMEGSKKVVAAIAKHQESPKYIIRELEKMTGITLKFS